MLRRKVLTQILIIEGTILGLFIFGFAIISQNYRSLEQKILQSNLVRVHNTLRRDMDNLHDHNFHWASQGGIYYSVRDDQPMTDWFQDILIDSFGSSVDISEAAIFGLDGELITSRSFKYNKLGGDNINQPKLLVQSIQNTQLVHSQSNPNLGFIVDRNFILLISTQPIFNPLSENQRRGTLVVARQYDSEAVAELGQIVQQDVLILPTQQLLVNVRDNNLKAVIAATPGKGNFIPLDNGVMGTYELIDDIYGQPTIGLFVQTPRDIILQARDTLWATAIGLLGFFIFRILYVLFFLDKSILLRLKNLNKNVEELTTSEDVNMRLEVQGRDEIAELTSSFNGLLDALENSRITLCNERDKAETTLASIGDAVITTDLSGRISYMNKAALTIFSDKADNFQQQPLENIFSPTDESGLSDKRSLAQRCIEASENIWESNFCHLVNAGGGDIIIESIACPMFESTKGSSQGKMTGVVIIFRDVSHAKRLQKSLIYQASHDGLTNLYNRSEFERQLSIVANSSHKNNQDHHLIFIDLDRFKLVNDSCGHIAGDKVLREIAQLMHSTVRKSDILARIGGDEFVVLLMDCKFARAYDVAEKIRLEVANFRFISNDKCFTFGASIGFVNLKDQAFSNDTDLLSMADKACMAAKNSGRNRIHVYRREDSQVAEHHQQTTWVNRVTDALEHNHFELYYQKITSTKNQQEPACCAEILLRMIGTNNEIIAPGAFLPAAERYGLMKFIDKWVIENFCQWANENIAIFNEIGTFSINLSGQSISDAEFLNYLVNYFTTPVISPKHICFEITETAAIQNIANARKFIDRLKKMGFSFSLDDFGSGMSSFNYLKHLAVDSLKIDGCFIKNIEHEPIDYSMVRSINEIGHIMGIKTVAEFVESKKIYAMVKELGVDFVQGYHIHKPTALNSLSIVQKKLSGF